MPGLVAFDTMTTLLVATTLVVVFAVTPGWWATRAHYPQPLPFTPIEGDTAPVHTPERPTAVVVLDHGTEASEFLLPYELLAATGAFNVAFAAGSSTAVTCPFGSGKSAT